MADRWISGPGGDLHRVGLRAADDAHSNLCFPTYNQFGYLIRKGFAMQDLADPYLLTALAALISSIASLVWAVRRNPGRD